MPYISYVPLTVLVPTYCWMPRIICYSTTLSLDILLTLKVTLVMQPHSFCQFLFFSFWVLPHEKLPSPSQKGVGNGVTSLWHTVRLVLLSSSISPTTHVLPHTPTRTFVLHLHIHSSSSLHSLIPPALTCPMELSAQVLVLSHVLSLFKSS